MNKLIIRLSVSFNTIASCLTRFSLSVVIGGLSSGSLVWKFFSMLFVILHHWIALRRINKVALCFKCVIVLRCSARSTNRENVERDLSLTTVEELRGNTSDLLLRHQQQSESQDIEFQCNMAYAGVGACKLKIKDHTSPLQAHPEWLELQENVAYQRPSELQKRSDFPVYETIS